MTSILDEHELLLVADARLTKLTPAVEFLHLPRKTSKFSQNLKKYISSPTIRIEHIRTVHIGQSMYCLKRYKVLRAFASSANGNL